MDTGTGLAFGDLLRRRRASAGLTQEELAENAGLTTQAISLLERGERRRPQRYTVRKLSEALGLEGESLAEFESAARPSARSRPVITPRNREVLIRTPPSAGVPTPCPVAITPTLSPPSPAKRTAKRTSCASSATTTTAGLWSALRFHAAHAPS